MMFRCALSTLLCLYSGFTYAKSDVIKADPVVVTATRTARTVDETLAPVTIITREDIESSQVKTVDELLNGVVGIEASVSGPFGKVTDIHVRGTNTNHVVVLIDGVRLGSATLGTFSWEFLPIEQIERIEIVRGPGSSLYGSDAIGGVIQVFTRKGVEGFRGGTAIGYGSFDSREFSANVSGAKGGTHYSVAAAQFTTEGINAKKPAPEFGGGPIYNEPDKDGFRTDSASARLGHRFANGLEIATNVLHSQGHSEYDGSFVNETDFIQNALSAELRFSLTADWHAKIVTSKSRDETDNFKDGVYQTTFNTIRHMHTLQSDFELTETQFLTLGRDYQKDAIESSTVYNATKRDNEGWLAQYQGKFGNHNVALGTRLDDTYANGDQKTGNIGWGYDLAGDELRLLASYGTAFKEPTFNQLYDPFVGNPNINPEESRSAEIGLRGKMTHTTWALRAFQTEIDQLIVFQPPTFQAVNINRARIRGIENEYSVGGGRNTATLYLTLLDPRDADTGALLPRRAKASLRVDDEYVLDRWRLGATLIAQSYRYDDPQNNMRLAGFGLLDLRAQYNIDNNWFVRAKIGNVLDKDYETAGHYNNAGRNYFLTVGYQPR